ncbi:MAG: hypothetical protein EBS19_07330, partial [Spirochaetia bacterium]|nr:hypothetical protein [Spirochaetia bacterium]
MAGETGTSGTSESEFPVFKSSEGAFDRAKYEEQLSGVVKNGQLTGKNIDEDLIKQKESADEVVRKAFKFYDESFNKSIKEIDPSIDIKSIYYQEAYSDGGSHTGKIRRKIEKGEALDGKEIFEMAKGNAKNKIANMTFLKNGRVTDIVENLGLKEIKEFDLFEDVKSDFNSKIKDENLKFEPLLENFSKVLHNFREIKIPTKEIYSTYYSPENMAIISALGKVLEAEGFTNENVTQMSKAYDENIKKLIETKGGKKAEDVIKEAAQEAKKEETATKTEEQKLEEKKVEEPKKEPTAENKDIKLDQPKEATNTSSTTTEEPKKAEEKKEPEVKTADQKLEEKKPEEKKGSKEKNEKIEEKGKNKQPTFSDPVKGVLDMLGIKSPDSKKEEGNKGDKDKGDKDKGDKDKGDK